MKKFKIALTVVLGLFFLNGCAQKQAAFSEQEGHSVKVAFTDFSPGLCHVYFVAEDVLQYDFKTNGAYTVTPGEYMVIMQCQKTNYYFKKEQYGAGNVTTFTSPGGREQVNTDLFKEAVKSL